MAKKYFIFVLTICITLCVLIIGCDYVAPQTSKAITEKDQLEQLKQQNELLKQQNQYLERIAIALENKK